MKRNNKKGFTIVELVIVIAVIGILAVVMIPVFSNVVGDAQANSAIMNARNVYTQYLAANPAAQVDYVKIDNVYYAVSNNFAVTDADDILGCDDILENGALDVKECEGEAVDSTTCKHCGGELN